MPDALKRGLHLIIGCFVLCLVPLLLEAEQASWMQDYKSGMAARTQGRFAEAKELLERALGAAELGTHDMRRANVNDMLASVCESLGQTEEAERLFRDAETILEGPHDADPALEFLVLDDLGSYRATQGRLTEAEVFLKKSLEKGVAFFGEDDAAVAAVRANLAQTYILEGRLADAEPLLERAVAIHQASLPATNMDRLTSEAALGTLYSYQGRYALAEKLLQEFNQAAARLGELHPEYAESLVMLADLYRLEGNRSRGEPLLRKALFIYEKSFGPDSPRVGGTLLDMSLDTLAEGKPALAQVEIGRALTILRSTIGPDHTTVAIGEFRLASAYFRLKKYAEATPLLEHALTVQEATYPGGSATIADCLFALARLAAIEHHEEEADHNYQKAIAMYEKSMTFPCPALREALREYAKLLRTKHSPEANVLIARAKQLDQMAKSWK
jgi:tetratricopeptide (TPR) repeat protein